MEEVDQIDEDEPESHEEILPLLEEATLNQYASQDDDLFTCSSIGTESDWEQQLINRVVSVLKQRMKMRMTMTQLTTNYLKNLQWSQYKKRQEW